MFYLFLRVELKVSTNNCRQTPKMTFRLTRARVTFVPRVVPALRLSLVLDYTLLATSDSSPCTSSRPFVTNCTSLGFHLAKNAAFVSPVEAHGVSDARRRARAAL